MKITQLFMFRVNNCVFVCSSSYYHSSKSGFKHPWLLPFGGLDVNLKLFIMKYVSIGKHSYFGIVYFLIEHFVKVQMSLNGGCFAEFSIKPKAWIKVDSYTPFIWRNELKQKKNLLKVTWFQGILKCLVLHENSMNLMKAPKLSKYSSC